MVLLYWVLFCFTWFFFLNNIILHCLTLLLTKRYIVKQGTVDYFCLPGRLRCFVLHEFKQVKLCWNVPFVLHLNRTLQFIIRVDFRTVRVDQSLIFCIGFCKLLLSIFFFFFQLLIAPFAASDCPCGGFWLPLWYLQTFLTVLYFHFYNLHHFRNKNKIAFTISAIICYKSTSWIIKLSIMKCDRKQLKLTKFASALIDMYKQFNVVRVWTVLTVWYIVFVFISIFCAISVIIIKKTLSLSFSYGAILCICFSFL